MGEYPIKIAILGGILGAFVIYISFKIVKRKIDKNSIYYKIEIGYNEKNVEVTTLLDTGNLLAEPITKCPVVIIEEKKLLHILDEESLNILKKGQMDKLDYLEEKLKLRCRVIPFNSIGKNNGILLGFKPDYIKLYNDEEKKIINDVIVCTCSNKFNKKYSGLIGLELLKEFKAKKTNLLDPYCGSGSSFSSGLEYGIKEFVGFDLNPLAILISKAKLNYIETDILNKERDKIKNKIIKKNYNSNYEILKSKILNNIKNIDFWIEKKTQEDLIFIYSLIENIKNKPNIKNIFLLAFSETLREASYTRNNEFKLFRMQKSRGMQGFS